MRVRLGTRERAIAEAARPLPRPLPLAALSPFSHRFFWDSVRVSSLHLSLQLEDQLELYFVTPVPFVLNYQIVSIHIFFSSSNLLVSVLQGLSRFSLLERLYEKFLHHLQQ